MSQTKGLLALKNIGEKLAARLNEIGVYSEQDLRSLGAVAAHKRIKEKYPNETLPVCYYLYSFEGALQNKHWNAIGDGKKEALKKHLEE